MLILTKPVGKGCPNTEKDVKALHQCLMMIGKIPCSVSNGVMNDTIMKGIMDVQSHFMLKPDGVISVNRTTHNFLKTWKVKPISQGVSLTGRLKDAWDLVNPLLPKESYCSSGFRSADDQRRILHNFFLTTYKSQIIAKYTQQEYDKVKTDLVKNEADVLKMVRGVGQAIATPGRSAHQLGKAIDVGGPPSIDDTQVNVIKMVAKANPTILSGKILKERNGCVHFEIR